MPTSTKPPARDSSFEHYRPLSKIRPQIRLLVVEPGGNSDALSGWLRHATLDHEALPSYETISYCWENAKLRDRMLVNGHLMDLPASATAAIRRMRWPDKSRTLWIDAVCINQSDAQERSAQVSAMDHFYSMADANLVYLGADTDGLAESTVKTLQETIRWVENEIKRLYISGREKRQYKVTGYLSEDLVSQIILTESTVESLMSLYDLPWFQRLWVIQEVALASCNVCFWGNTTFDLRIVMTLSRLMIRSDFGHSDGIFAARSMLDFSRNRPPRFIQQLRGFRLVSRHMLASEPRDHVFALLGLFRRHHNLREVPALLKPDYQKSLTLVFRDATRYLINEQVNTRSSTRDCLDDVCHRSQIDITANNMPSWTLKWDRKFDPTLDSLNQSNSFSAGVLPQRRHRQVHPNYQYRIAHPADMDVLTLQGMFIGEINWSTPPIADGPPLRPTGLELADKDVELQLTNVNDVLLILDGVVSAVMDGPYESPGVHNVAAEVLTGYVNTVSRRFPEFDSTELMKEDGIKELLRYLRETADFPLTIAEIKHPEHLPYASLVGIIFCTIFRRTAAHRCFFKIGTGHVGIGPKVLRPGDCIAALPGKGLLFVLRPVGKEYQILGPAMVAGLMHGEVFEMGISSEWINIR